LNLIQPAEVLSSVTLSILHNNILSQLYKIHVPIVFELQKYEGPENRTLRVLQLEGPGWDEFSDALTKKNRKER